jgi:hypothetical protein
MPAKSRFSYIFDAIPSDGDRADRSRHLKSLRWPNEIVIQLTGADHIWPAPVRYGGAPMPYGQLLSIRSRFSPLEKWRAS